jgi:hypothetical protein
MVGRTTATPQAGCHAQLGGAPLGFTIVSNESLQLLESRLGRLRSEHESRLLFLGNGPLEKFDPMRKITFGESLAAYIDAARAELSSYTGLVRSEVLSLVEQLMLPLSQEKLAAILAVVERQFDPSLYPKRLKLFEEAMVRKGGSYGLRVDEWGIRTDIAGSKHHVGTENLIRRSLSALKDDLELLRLRPQAERSASGSQPETKLEQVNRLVKLEPNLFGIGLNLNHLIRRFLGKKE